MKRLIHIVKEARIDHEDFFSRMAEDYIAKAKKVLSEFLKNPENIGYRFISVEVTNINFSKGTVTVGSALVSAASNPYADLAFVKADKFANRTVLESEIDSEKVIPFIEQLKKLGFKYFVYPGDENFTGYHGLYPFVEIV